MKLLSELVGAIMIFVIGYIALLWGVALGFH
jgi:nitrogen fixation-related uncharacterized protein